MNMNLKDNIKLSLKRIFRNKKNIYFIISLSMLSFILSCIVVFKTNMLNFVNNTIIENIGYRTILVSPSDDEKHYDKLINIDHVDYVYSSKFSSSAVYSSFKTDDLDGVLELTIGNNYTLPKNIYGERFSADDTGVAICPINFYPSSEADQLFVKNELMLDGRKMLNKDFDINYSSYKIENNARVKDKDYKKTFKIIGLYDSLEITNLNNVCFVSERDIKDIENSKNSINDSQGVSYGFFLIVDKKENVSSVINTLNENNIENDGVKIEADTSTISQIVIVCNVSIIIIFIASMFVIIFFIKKKVLTDTYSIGALRMIGYNKKNIFCFFGLEIIIMCLISFVLSLILFYIIYLMVYLIIVKPYINYLFQIKIYWGDFLYPLIICLLIPIVFGLFYLIKVLNKSVRKLIERS